MVGLHLPWNLQFYLTDSIRNQLWLASSYEILYEIIENRLFLANLGSWFLTECTLRPPQKARVSDRFNAVQKVGKRSELQLTIWKYSSYESVVKLLQ
jgi:hypothetical protein